MAPPVKPADAKAPALNRSLMVDTVNGKIRIRKWPEKRPGPLPEQVVIQNERFRDAQRLAVSMKGALFNRFIDATKGTGLYPRDLVTKLCLAPPFEIEMPDGRTLRHGRPWLETVMFQGCILGRTGNLALPANTAINMPWQDPIIDTSNFWDPAEPEFITIPEGVTVIEITAGMRLTSEIGGNMQISIQEQLPTPRLIATTLINGGGGCQVTSGAIVTTAGQRYTIRPYSQSGNNVNAQYARVSVTILAAEV